MPGRNGATYLTPCMLTYHPIDLVILMLGTNDLKHWFGKSAFDIAAGAGYLVETILRSECGPDASKPEILLICPPPIARLTIFAGFFDGAPEKSSQLALRYHHVAEFYGVNFISAGDFIVSSAVDGTHFDADQHQKLRQAVAQKVREIFA